MTENTPDEKPGTKSTAKRNALIFGAVTVAGVALFVGVAFGAPAFQKQASAPNAFTTAAPTALAATVDKTLFPKYLANSVAKMKSDGGVFMSSGANDPMAPVPNVFSRLYNPDATTLNLDSNVQTGTPTGESTHVSRITTITPEQLFAQGGLADGTTVPLTGATSRVEQVSPTKFQNTEGAQEVYDIKDGLIVRISAYGSGGPADTGITYGFNEDLLNSFNADAAGWTAQ